MNIFGKSPSSTSKKPALPERKGVSSSHSKISASVAALCLSIAAMTGCAIDATQPQKIPTTPTTTEVTKILELTKILSEYPSLKEVRQHLDAIKATDESKKQTFSGSELLQKFEGEYVYDPLAPNNKKLQQISVLNNFTFASGADRLFFINVLNGLAVEASKKLPWSLADYSPEEIRNLFIQNDTIAVNTSKNGLKGDLPEGMPNTEHHQYPVPDDMIEDAHVEQLNLVLKIISGAKNQEEAVEHLIRWMKANITHADENYGWGVYLTPGEKPLDDGGAVAYPKTLDAIYKERVTGCHEPTIMLEGMAHGINIPAVRLSMHAHGVLYLPTMNKFIHVDHVASYVSASPNQLMLDRDTIMAFANNAKEIFSIFMDNNPTYVPISRYRKGNNLTIDLKNYKDFDTGKCKEIADDQWQSIATELKDFAPTFDTATCSVSGKSISIQTLEEMEAK
ncbi:MAG: hypothetical protein WC101_04865 [Candidatus Gracilibacteria bacterium]